MSTKTESTILTRRSSSSRNNDKQYRSSSLRRQITERSFSNHSLRKSNRYSVQEVVQNAESKIERAIVESRNPIEVNDAEEVIINEDEKGYWLNKEEAENWQGPIPIDEYRLNEDPNPIVVKKKPSEKLNYKQEVHIKYLKPPTPKPAEILVIQEPDKQLPPAPPLVVRTAPSRLPSPEPIIIREAPPPSPCPTQRKVIVIPGKVLPPPARKVIYEKLPEYPQKPQKIIIERWLKAKQPKPKIILCKQIEKPCYKPVNPNPPLCDYQTSYTCYPNCFPSTTYTTGSFDPQIVYGSTSHRARHNNNSNRKEYVYDVYL